MCFWGRCLGKAEKSRLLSSSFLHDHSNEAVGGAASAAAQPAQPLQQEAGAVEEADEDNQTLLARVAPLLQKGSRKVLSDFATQAQMVQTSRRNLLRGLTALGEACLQTQLRLEKSVLEYVSLMDRAKKYVPVLYLRHVKHDATPLHLHCQYQTGAGLTGTGFTHVTKVTVIEVRWSVLLERVAAAEEPAEEPRHLFLTGAYGVTMRSSENCTAETIMKLLSTSPQPEERLLAPFLFKWRLVESDMCKANLRAEALLLQAGSWPSAVLHGVCGAHLCHHVAVKSWDMMDGVMSGCIQTYLALNRPGAMQRFTDAMVQEIAERFTVVLGRGLDEDAAAHRDAVIRLFAPRPARRKAHSTIMVLCHLLFNGDMRTHAISHHCLHCCDSVESARACALAWAPILVQQLRFKMLSRADWAQWLDALSLLGFLSGMNALFRSSFLRAFTPELLSDDHLNTDGLDERDMDPAAHVKLEQSRNLQKAVAFWQSRPEWKLHVLATTLQQQQHAMSKILRMSGANWEHEQCQRMRQTGNRIGPHHSPTPSENSSFRVPGLSATS